MIAACRSAVCPLASSVSTPHHGASCVPHEACHALLLDHAHACGARALEQHRVEHRPAERQSAVPERRGSRARPRNSPRNALPFGARITMPARLRRARRFARLERAHRVQTAAMPQDSRYSAHGFSRGKRARSSSSTFDALAPECHAARAARRPGADHDHLRARRLAGAHAVRPTGRLAGTAHVPPVRTRQMQHRCEPRQVRQERASASRRRT